MDTTRRQYTAEFKRGAVALVTEQGYAVAAAARNLGITPALLHNWPVRLGAVTMAHDKRYLYLPIPCS